MERTTRFRVIPVIDLRGGIVVRARRGERDAYAPSDTPLARGSSPAAVARGLLEACPSDVLYVADLDAIIEGRPFDARSLSAIREAAPGVTLWVDAGFDDPEAVARFEQAGFGRPVIGSESQRDERLVRSLGERAVLSLDSRGAERMDPAGLHDRPALWPHDVIAMTLSRVGAGQGPDLSAITSLRAARPGLNVYAAGGVRDARDLNSLREAGAAGALVASALHDGTLQVGSA